MLARKDIACTLVAVWGAIVRVERVPPARQDVAHAAAGHEHVHLRRRLLLSHHLGRVPAAVPVRHERHREALVRRLHALLAQPEVRQLQRAQPPAAL